MPPTTIEKEAELIAAEQDLIQRSSRKALAVMTGPPAVTADQMDLITRTVAVGATPDELKLYLYDCARRGVHPLDHLLHFTKRSGKYTPITSIDFMRQRAAETGDYAGSDDAIFVTAANAVYPSLATVTVWRMVGGMRCAFTATARWSEYKPDQNDFMWVRMPFTMLSKCAEALALRKGFPRQLAGLYSNEEMEQAGPPNGAAARTQAIHVPSLIPSRELVAPSSAPNDVSESGTSSDVGIYPPGVVLIERIDASGTKNPAVTKYLITTSTGETYSTIKDGLAALARECRTERTPVQIRHTKSRWGMDLVGIVRAELTAPAAPLPPVEADEIPF